MAVGKNKRLSKGGKKSQQKRKVADFMTIKSGTMLWHQLLSPNARSAKLS